MWQPSDRFWRPEIRLATDFCDVAQTLYKYWFGHKFDLLRRLPRDQHVNITKDVCKKSPSPPGPASPASPASQPQSTPPAPGPETYSKSMKINGSGTSFGQPTQTSKISFPGLSQACPASPASQPSSTGNQLYSQPRHRQPVIFAAKGQATSYTGSSGAGNQLYSQPRRRQPVILADASNTLVSQTCLAY